MALWLQLNDNGWINRDAFILFRVREHANSERWVVEGCDARGAVTINEYANKELAEEFLNRFMERKS